MEPVTNAENIRRGKSPKLTMEIAREIRRTYIPEHGNLLAFARRCGVHHSTIKRILDNTRWKED